MSDSDQKWTWKDLGVSTLVEERKEYEGRPIMMREPPREVVERTIEACLAETKKREEEKHKERMENSFYYRVCHNVIDYVRNLLR